MQPGLSALQADRQDATKQEVTVTQCNGNTYHLEYEVSTTNHVSGLMLNFWIVVFSFYRQLRAETRKTTAVTTIEMGTLNT